MADSKNVLTASDATFESEVLKSDTLALVDFWAEWCGPCKMLGPTIDAVAEDYAGRVKVFKLNVDENPNTPPQFSIRGIPTVILFKDGKPVEQLVGVQTKDAFSQAIDKHL